jgi:integrase/recombinase XerD
MLPTMSIKKLIQGANAKLRELKYGERDIKYNNVTWHSFQEFCDTKGYTRYSSAINDEFVAMLQNHQPSYKPVTLQRKIVPMKMLDLFAKTGTWEKGLLNPPSPLSTNFQECLSAQDTYLEKYGYSESSRTTMYKGMSRILQLFQSMGVTNVSEINGDHISAYFLTLKGHARSTVRGELSRLRQFFSYMYLLGYTTSDLSAQVPKYRMGQPRSMVKIWESDEINKVLDVVDKANPKGKRDAAYILIASELGMRSGDIRNLKLSDIDWDACTIAFTQSKTGKPNTMPLNEKLGQAIIDYLHVRPETESEYLFVSLIPPYEQMRTFNTSFQTYVHRAEIKTSPDRHYGLHSLRATVATKLLGANVSPDVIFPFLGHSDREALIYYLRFDIENLRDCALSYEDGVLI